MGYIELLIENIIDLRVKQSNYNYVYAQYEIKHDLHTVLFDIIQYIFFYVNLNCFEHLLTCKYKIIKFVYIYALLIYYIFMQKLKSQLKSRTFIFTPCQMFERFETFVLTLPKLNLFLKNILTQTSTVCVYYNLITIYVKCMIRTKKVGIPDLCRQKNMNYAVRHEIE